MGVTGAGKTTVGTLLAEQLGWEFADADQFHSAANIEKMRQGIPLDDCDRGPWLQSMRDAIQRWIEQNKNVVLACSALKDSYRQLLGVGGPVKLVYLKASFELVHRRLQSRHGHFATATILQNQFETLEEPEGAVVVDVDGTPADIVASIRKKLDV